MRDKEKDLLRVIQGGKAAKDSGKAKVKAGRVGLAASGLTLKQEAFAEALANGATNAEAYRQAYNADGMAQTTIWQEGCKLAQHPKVAQRVEALLAEKQARNSMQAVKAEQRIWKGVWDLAEGAEVPPAVKATALGLAARMAGMFNDKLTLESQTSAADLERELAERLASYAKAMKG